MFNLTLLSQLLVISAVLAAIFCSLQLLRFDRLIEEFRTYSAGKRSSADEDRALESIVRVVFNRCELDKQQKILRTEAIVAGGSTAMLMGWLFAVTIVTW